MPEDAGSNPVMPPNIYKLEVSMKLADFLKAELDVISNTHDNFIKLVEVSKRLNDTELAELVIELGLLQMESSRLLRDLNEYTIQLIKEP